MSKQASKPEQEQAATEEKSFDMTLDEFCAELSQADRRVELIGAFHAIEKQARRVKASKAVFSDRFQKFTKLPA